MIKSATIRPLLFLFAGSLSGLLACLTPDVLAQPRTPRIVNHPDLQITLLPINDAADDFAPVVVRGGELMMFTSSRSGPFGSEGTQRIWTTSNSPSGWSSPVTATQALSRARHVGGAALTPDGNSMVFGAYDWQGRDELLIGHGRTDLYSAERIRGEWGNLANLGEVVNSDAWDSQPSMSPDGRTLYFASDRDGGKGGSDIYVTRWIGSGWTPPVNIGAPVNTLADELSPSIAADGRSLFFASNGHGGLGGFDLFVARGGDESGAGWDSLENMGAPINSYGDDIFFVSLPNSQNGYFASNRAGNHDIYLAYPNPYPVDPLVTVSGRVVDAVSSFPIAADIAVTDLETGDVVATYRTDDRTGSYYVVLTPGRRYSVTAESPTYVFYSDEYVVPPRTEGRDLEKDIVLFRSSTGSTRLLVFFEFDKAELKRESFPDLRRAVDFLKSNPEMKVEIAGHTDSVGTESYNQKLSQERAEAVLRHLAAAGIDRKRLVARGYGEVQPVTGNDTEQGRAQNRRVEMRATSGGAGSRSQPRR